MKKGAQRKHEILERLADHLLANGLHNASLRPLAAAAGTSDRMLLHYFADKEDLLTAVLNVISARLVALLDSVHIEPLPWRDLLPLLAGMLDDPRIKPYMRLWLELVAAMAEAQEPFRSSATSILTTLQDWIAGALLVEHAADREPLAALTLTLVEGLVMLDALGAADTAAAALAGLARVR